MRHRCADDGRHIGCIGHVGVNRLSPQSLRDPLRAGLVAVGDQHFRSLGDELARDALAGSG